MTRYRYTPLSVPRQIRLLRLHAGVEDDELCGDLVQVSLDEAPDFTALSYAWGDPQPQRTITFLGLQAQLEIGPSLHSALQHLRQEDSEVLVWADALCINQEDTSERNHQVRMMGAIYAAAHLTVIWLGEDPTGEMMMAFDWLRRFDDFSELSQCFLDEMDEMDDLDHDIHDAITNELAETVLELTFGKHRGAAFGHIGTLLSRPWFTRKWVIQELVKSQAPCLVAGRHKLHWRLLAGWVTFLQSHHAVLENFVLFCAQPLEADSKKLTTSLLRATILTQTAEWDEQNLLCLLPKTLMFRCSDPRDHVFALAGIASDTDRFDLVDYGTTLEDVCQRLAHVCTSDSTSLKLLWSLVQFTPLGDRVPSWVPNLKSVLAGGEGSSFVCQFTTQQLRDYNASADSVLQAKLADNGKTLTTRGRIIDRLQLLGSNYRNLGNSHSVRGLIQALYTNNRHHASKEVQEMARLKHRWVEQCIAIVRTMGNADGVEAFRDALLCDSVLIQDVPQAVEMVRADFSTHITLLQATVDRAFNDDDGWLVPMREAMGLGTSYHLLGAIIDEKVQRRFGRTENERIGWFPSVAEATDLVCVFDGMELPYALRPAADGRYLLVGECIIPGLMMGEAMKMPGVSSELVMLA